MPDVNSLNIPHESESQSLTQQSSGDSTQTEAETASELWSEAQLLDALARIDTLHDSIQEIRNAPTDVVELLVLRSRNSSVAGIADDTQIGTPSSDSGIDFRKNIENAKTYIIAVQDRLLRYREEMQSGEMKMIMDYVAKREVQAEGSGAGSARWMAYTTESYTPEGVAKAETKHERKHTHESQDRGPEDVVMEDSQNGVMHESAIATTMETDAL